MRWVPLVMLLTGCVSTAHYQSWVGAPADDLVLAWGAPDEHIDRGNGNEAFTYYPGAHCRVTVGAVNGVVATVSARDETCGIPAVARNAPPR